MAKRPAAALGDDTPDAKLERKICVLCRLIVRGQWAKNRIEVKVYITLRIFSIIIAACAGAGLIADKVNQNLTVHTGWAFWGALLVLVFGILVQVSDVLNIERVATHARVLSAMCKRYETELGIILAEEDPVDSVNELSKQVKNTILDPNNHATLPDDSTSQVRDVSDALAQKLIDDHKPTWRLPPEQRQT